MEPTHLKLNVPVVLFLFVATFFFTAPYAHGEGVSESSESFEKEIDYPAYNPDDSEQFVIDSNSDWDAINDSGKRIFWVEPGDYTGKGTIRITADGTSSSRRWILYRNPDNPDKNRHIWDMNNANRALVAYLLFEDADYWVVDRIRMESGIRVTGASDDTGSSDYNVFNRMMWKDATNDYIRSGIRMGRRHSHDPGHNQSLATENTLQNSIIAGIQPVDSSTDVVGVAIIQGENNRVVNCEIFDVTDCVQTNLSEATAKSTKIQNCDMYYTQSFADDPDSRIENAIDIKAHWPDSEAPADKSEWLLIDGNRIRDFNVILHWEHSNYIRVINNIFFNVKNFSYAVPKKLEINYKHELSNNVIYNTEKGFKPRHTDDSLYTKNIFVDVPGTVWSWFSDPENNVVRKNVFINSDVGSVCLSNTVETNAYYNSTPFDCDDTDGQNGTIIRSSGSDANHTDLDFQFRQISGPVNRTIPNGKVTEDSPHASWFDTSPENTPPEAGFSYDPNSPTPGEVVQFLDESTDTDGTISSYSWDFGDGTTSTNQDPTHTYDTAGSYTVTLVVTDDRGATDSISKTVDVSEPDSEAPEPPRNLNVLPKDRGVKLTWDRSPSSDVADYRVTYREQGTTGGSETSFGTRTSGVLDGLTNGTTYEFDLVAVDASGNVSDPIQGTETPRAGIRYDGNSYSDIQSAVDAAALDGGGTVRLGAMDFSVGSTLTLHGGVSLAGEGPGMTLLTGMDVHPVVEVQTDSGNSTIRIGDLTITGTQSGPGLLADGDGSVRVDHVVFLELGGVGMKINNSARPTVINNTFLKNLEEAVVTKSGDNTFRNNLYAENGGYAIDNRSGASVTASHFNAYANNGPETTYFDENKHFNNVTIGPGYLSKRVKFRDAGNGDYRIEEGAPTIDQGHPTDAGGNEPAPNGGRVNVGAYGNTTWAARTGLNHPPKVSGNQTYRAEVNLNGTYRKLRYRADSEAGGVKLSWRVPFHRTDLTADPALYSFDVMYRQRGTVGWNTAKTDTATIEDDPDDGDIFFVSGQKEIGGLNNGKQYDTVLVVYYDDGGTKKVVDPVAMTVVPGTGGGSGSSSSSRCFVATAAWASPAAPAVLNYRKVRDRFLLHLEFGETGVKKYYRCSPPAAEALQKSELMKRMTRTLLK